jgi:hypothetical protein
MTRHLQREFERAQAALLRALGGLPTGEAAIEGDETTRRVRATLAGTVVYETPLCGTKREKRSWRQTQRRNRRSAA